MAETIVKDLEGKGIIVTGATRGIGRAIALEAARRGANVAFNYVKSEQQADEVKAEIEKLGVKSLAYKVDVGDLKSVRDMVNAVKKEFGTIDGLVNNAGLTRDKVFVMMSEEDWSEVIRTNLTGAFNFARAAVFMMMKAKRGSILNITSISGVIGLPGQVNYSASKAGLIGLTKSLAKEVGRLGVRVNALALGFIETDMTAALPEENRKQALDMIPLGRFGKVEDVTPTAAFLLSDASAYITGAVIHVDGGLAM
ncbi:MAG TPA: 3-oxoacyl-[acyl-carrier-protein] reductase [Candidatus Binataceae bacterium]|nr:3-oxoacyl-[acyl-carrier-protein] reductase [Candidatus Binataceae bacterium]